MEFLLMTFRKFPTKFPQRNKLYIAFLSFLRKIIPKFSIKEIANCSEKHFINALKNICLAKRIAFFIGYTKIVALCKLLGLLFSAFYFLLGLQHFFFSLFCFFVVGHKTQRLQLRIARGNVERRNKNKNQNRSVSW